MQRTDPPVILIAAMSSLRVIGTRDGMPWHVPDEYRQYLSFVRDQTVIMGRKSFEIFGRDLTSIHNLVISRSTGEGDGYTVCKSLEEALETAKSFNTKIFVAGGASIYAQALPVADEMYLSVIKGSYDGVAHFPEFDVADWKLVVRNEHPKFTFYHYLRKC